MDSRNGFVSLVTERTCLGDQVRGVLRGQHGKSGVRLAITSGTFHPVHIHCNQSSNKETFVKLDTQLVLVALLLFSSRRVGSKITSTIDIIVSAIISDLINRSASFVISKYFQEEPGIDKTLQRLQKVLLRIGTVVQQAEERCITNQGMLRQLGMLRQGMYRGHYMLDALRFRALGNGDEEVSRSSSTLSRFSPAKRLRFSGTGSSVTSSNRETVQLLGTFNNIRQELQRMVHNLEGTMDGMKEFIFFLGSYPRITCQPYGACLLLDNCMFGRQRERQQVLEFLLRPPGASPDLDVLPIVGPIRVGKSTLVEHVCRDESVRDRFSTIFFFLEESLKDEGVINLRKNNISGHLVKHQNCVAQNRLLIIVEVAEDIDEGTWSRLKSSATCMMAPCGGGSKIIITSRSDRIVNLGTTEALRLEDLPPEAYWHFFKSLAFGSTNHYEHPKLAAMAMEIASEQGQCFKSARIVAGLLNNNFNAPSWRMILECVRAHKQKNLHLFGKHPNLLMRQDELVYYWRLTRSCRYFLICSHHQLDSTEEVPKITVQDILLGSSDTLPHGEFEALAWRSRIPPYYNYTISCIVQEPQQHTVIRKKRVHHDEGHLI